MKVSPIGILFAIHLLVAGYFSWIICFSVGLPLLILSSILPFFNNVMSFVTSFVMTTFMQSIIFFVEHIYGTNITTSGDQINNIDPKTHQPIPLILISHTIASQHGVVRTLANECSKFLDFSFFS